MQAELQEEQGERSPRPSTGTQVVHRYRIDNNNTNNINNNSDQASSMKSRDEPVIVKMCMRGDLSEFDDEKRRKMCSAITRLMKIHIEHIKIKKTKGAAEPVVAEEPGIIADMVDVLSQLTVSMGLCEPEETVSMQITIDHDGFMEYSSSGSDSSTDVEVDGEDSCFERTLSAAPRERVKEVLKSQAAMITVDFVEDASSFVVGLCMPHLLARLLCLECWRLKMASGKWQGRRMLIATATGALSLSLSKYKQPARPRARLEAKRERQRKIQLGTLPQDI